MRRFRDVLERTPLESVIHLASTISTRFAYLDALHDIVYGDAAKHLRERSQLHWIVEEHCWLFAPQYNLASSDERMRKVLVEHRKHAKLASLPEPAVDAIRGINDIPDLFLVASALTSDRPRNRHAVIEIKAPNVKITNAEIGEIKHYAKTILQSGAFDKKDTHWDLFIVSSTVDDDVDSMERGQRGRPYHCVGQPAEHMDLWCFSWAELIARARAEMNFAMGNLKMRSMDVSDYLKKHQPAVYADMHKPRMAPSPAVAPAASKPKKKTAS
jgi:hypothetical protein